MPLKRIEVHGFKSFADKIEFQFNPGITLIVGPNGSGKSNVADAVRWVLGEQSAKSLRGAKMEDIIFSGSDKRKPVGMAEVSLTLDNSNGLFPIEYSEITVTRRVYRSGESDYLINKAPCRLKDIHELFTDTGIGKEGYSIIGQGKIDEILSTKSEDRRVLIEEAAGIVKYRNRKAEAVRKLTDTEQNLTRISDIINELKTQVGPLAEQAQKAQDYLDFKDELSSLEINLLINQLEEQKEKYVQAQENAEKLKMEVTARETLSKTNDSKIEELRLEVNKLDEEISKIQQKIYDFGSEIEKKESNIKIDQERTKSLDEQKKRLEKEISSLDQKLQSLEGEFADDEKHLKELTVKISSLSQELETRNSAKDSLETEITNLQEQIESGKGDIIDLLNQIANKRNEINNLNQEDINYRKKEEQINADLAQYQQETEKISRQIGSTNQEITKLDNRQKEIENRFSQNKISAGKLNDQLARINSELNQLNIDKQQKLSRSKVLNEMQEQYEGFQKGVKEVLLARKKAKLQGIEGVIAELLKVPAKYETAVEVLLGGALQNIVTDTDENAKEAIKHLKQNNMGRATFLPLNTIKPSSHRDEDKKAVKMAGALGFAVDLINFEDKFRPVFEYLLGRSIVVENIDQALKIARECRHKVRLVTLDGDLLSPGGSLTGGSYNRKGSNLLGRNREIDELEKTIAGLTEKYQQKEKDKLNITKDIEELADQTENLKQEQQNLSIERTGLTKDLEQLSQESKRLNREIEVLRLEQDQLSGDRKKSVQREEELSKELAALELKDNEIKNTINMKQQELELKQENKALLDNEITGFKVDLASLQQEQLNQEQSLSKYHQLRDEHKDNISAKEKEINEIDSQKDELSLHINDLERSLKELVEAKINIESTLEENRNLRLTKNQELMENESRNKEIQKQMAGLQGELRNAEVKVAKLETEVENYTNRLLEEHSLTPEEALLQKKDIPNRREVTGRIKELKNLIGDLGVVNIGAIEEYARVKERYDFLCGQYSDLEEARLTLYQVIEEMDEIMVQRFQEAFILINKNFSEVFGELFGGGKAELKMTNAENILETGVEIIAQPPGKKPQHLSLLSGGERALTAIALLFAILKVKPSPFCVLDEIEASLDEANVSRFADFLKEFSAKTQFIVISHRKGTMEAADVLYGITIDETGVSKMVSMKFTGEEEKVS